MLVTYSFIAFAGLTCLGVVLWLLLLAFDWEIERAVYVIFALAVVFLCLGIGAVMVGATKG